MLKPISWAALPCLFLLAGAVYGQVTTKPTQITNVEGPGRACLLAGCPDKFPVTRATKPLSRL